MTITSNLMDQIERLGVVEGEIDNVLEAALRDIGQFIVDDLRDPGGDWPRFGGPRPPSLRKDEKVPDRKGRPHSGDLWMVQQPGKLEFIVVNDASYSSFVHVGHPRASVEVAAFGLANVLIVDILDAVSEDPIAAVSDRVLMAIENGETL